MDIERTGPREFYPRRVLLADDSQVIRKAIASLLSSDPEIELVGEAESLQEALRMARKLKPDIIILDLHLDESESPSKVKARLSGTPLLAICVWTDAESQALASQFGALRLLGKGSLADELIPAIKQEAYESRRLPLESQSLPPGKAS
jgi:DNA-binding NarL/FixJ family response regulator